MTLSDLQLPRGMSNPVKLQEALKRIDEREWIEKGERRALRLFYEMAEQVPAYKDFLKKHGVRPESIRSARDINRIPPMDKDTYLRAYPLKDLCWNRDLAKRWYVFSATSGSTGEPFYFPRDNSQDWQYALTAELYLRENFQIHKKSTLYIDGFAMGAWIGGLFTYQAIKNIAERGNYKLNIITPGINKGEIIKAVETLAHNYDQVIIGGYPPFVKDTIDEGINRGFNWKKYPIKFIFSAEGFSEAFRDYVVRQTGLKNIYRDTLNHYGTVDLGTMAHETSTCILIRRLALKNKILYRKIFSDVSKLPTLAQYLPELFHFEAENGNLFCSAYSGLPLVRYDLKDRGGIITLEEMRKIFKSCQLDLDQELEKAGIEKTLWNLPFVYVYERSDFVISISGANIYPESIRKALQKKAFENFITGKFTMLAAYTKDLNQQLEVNIELKAGKKGSKQLENAIKQAVIDLLLKENTEYKSQYDIAPERAIPRIQFWENGHGKYFNLQGKQKWVLK